MGNRHAEPLRLPRQLRVVRGNIRAINVPSHSIRYIAGNWKSWFPRDRDVHWLIAHLPSPITRGRLFDLASAAANGSVVDLRRLFLGTMMWGYGPRGGRPSLNVDAAVRSPDFPDALVRARDEMRASNPQAAYLAMTGLPRVREPFFTKFLYFLGSAYPNLPYVPLILDGNVRASLNCVLWPQGWTAAARGKVESKRGEDLWVFYCLTLSAWAKELGCPRPDQVELFLFKPD